MATSFAPVLLQLFDNLGAELAGGKVYTYEAGTTTPLATYQDLAGATPNANPVVLDSAGRATIRVTDGVAYKFIVKDSSDNTIQTNDNIIVGEAEEESEDQYEICVAYRGTPEAQGWMGGVEIKRAVAFPANFAGSGGAVVTAPDDSYAISVRKNGAEVGTATIDTSGVFTFATTAGATVSLVDGDTVDFYGPDSVGTASNIKITLVGDL